jgi:isopenicillin-N epimerase
MDWNAVRKSFMIPERIAYLNTGTAGPCPAPVFEQVVAWQRRIEGNPTVEFYALFADAVGPAKAKLAAFAGTAPANLVYVMNVTQGMNMFAAGIRGMEPGDEILSTDREYGAVNHAWECAAERRGLIIRRIALPGIPESHEQIVRCFEQGIGPRTKLVYFCHVTSAGVIMPVQRICRLARERGVLTAIDGAHALGMVPLDLDALGCDFYTGNGHKWLCAPNGSGFLFAAPAVQPRLAPFFAGWGWVRGNETFLGNYENPGTHNPTPFLGMAAAVDFLQGIGFESVMARGRALAGYARQALAQVDGIQSLAPAGEEFRCPLVSYLLPAGTDGRRVRQMLDRDKLVVLLVPEQDRWRLRVSTHLFNTESEIDRLVRAVQEACAAPCIGAEERTP